MSTESAKDKPRRILVTRPVHAVGGESYTGWYRDANSSQVVYLAKGSNVTPIKKSEEGKVICRVTHRLLLIPEVELEEIGWN